MPDLSSSTRRIVHGATRTYECSPLNDAAHDALSQYVQDAYMIERRQVIDKLSPGAQQDAAIRIVLHESIALTWFSPIGVKYMSTINGMMRLAYEGCRINDKTLEFNAFKADILAKYKTESEAVRESRTTFEALNPSIAQPSLDPKAQRVPPTVEAPRRLKKKKSTQS